MKAFAIHHLNLVMPKQIFMKNKIKIRSFGHEYIGGQFLQEIMENHSTYN